MGCWNETCSLSNLPILLSEKVKFVILLNTGVGGRSYYYNDAYIPLCLPISGEYNEYGSVKNIKIDSATLNLLQNQKFYTVDKHEDEISDDKIEKFNKTLKHYGCSSISYVDMNSVLNFKDYNFTTIEEFVDDISQDSVFFKYHDKYYLLQLALYHENLYDTLVDTFAKRIPYEQINNLYDLWEKKIKKYYDGKKEYYELKKLPEDDLTEEQLKKMLRYEFDESIFKTSQYGYNFVKEYEKDSSISENSEYISLLINYILFTYSLSFGRNGYYATSGLGSQMEERKVQMVIATWILEYCKNKEKEYREIRDYDDDQDPNEEVVWWRE